VTSPERPHEPEEDVPVALDVPRFVSGYGVRPIAATGPLLGQTLARLDVRRRFGVTVIGKWPGHAASATRKLEPVQADDAIAPGDLLLAAGSDGDLDRFARFAGDSEPSA
jgi:Trk K+ transport system NAD-binding subunit